MRLAIGEYELDTAIERTDFGRVHSWLTECYWSPEVSFERVVRAAEGSSLVISAFWGEAQVGYLRVVSDRTTFAWICDVYVDSEHRGKGIAKAMVRFALDHPDHQDLRRWILATKDAHEIYASCGFEPLLAPDRWMLRGGNPSN
jgi:GNAT superfamily N-acetyltransferase